MPAPRKIALASAFAVLCVIWSSTWLVIKIGLRDLPPASFVAARFLIAIAVLVAISAGRVRMLPKGRGDFALLAFTGTLMFALNYGLLFWAELHVSSGLAAVLQATIPIFGLIFAHFFLPGEPLRWQRIAGALVAVGGVALICGHLLDRHGVMAFWGGIAIVIGSAAAAWSNVLLKRRALDLAPAMIATWQMIFGAAPMIVLALKLDGNPAHLHWTGMALACVVYLAVIGSALAFLLLYWLLPRMPVTNLQTISLITPPGAVALGWMLGGELFSRWLLVGGALVLVGVWIIFQTAKPRVTVPA